MDVAFEGRHLRNEMLAPWMAYRIGGPAEHFLMPRSERDIQSCLDYAHRNQIPLITLGAGSNLLVRDGGVEGMVLYLGAGLEGGVTRMKEDRESITLRVPSHWPKAQLLSLALKEGWGGLEFSAGIPGTMGGAVFMNAGTKWGSYGDVIEKVRLYHSESGVVEKTKDEMKFKYRGHGEGLLSPGTVVLTVDIKLVKCAPEGIHRLVDEILCYRGSKQPLELPNCGSVFKNPENSERGAGRLIEAAGLKGLRVGRAQISRKHANFILNLGGARSADVEELMERARASVQEKFGIALESEVIVIGRR